VKDCSSGGPMPFGRSALLRQLFAYHQETQCVQERECLDLALCVLLCGVLAATMMVQRPQCVGAD
jgi:hypothetical protein